MKAKEKSRLGQNFLTDARAQRLIVDALGAAAMGDVVEIGPGKAAITHLLAGRAAHLTAIELDGAFASLLRSQFAGMASVQILEADVLSVDFSSLARKGGRSLAIIGNLPYYITSPILQHLFTHEELISRAVVMVQREVAERITALPGSRDYGLLSVLCQLHAQAELLFTLPPESFTPPPGVHSAVVRLQFAPRWIELGVSPEPFRRFLQACFAQKRKTLHNNLRAAGYQSALIINALASCAKSVTARAEELSPAELATLFRTLQPTP